MDLVLHVTEKADVARKLRQILSDGEAQIVSATPEFCETHKFQFDGRNHLAIVVNGHLKTLEFRSNITWYTPPAQLYKADVIRTFKKKRESEKIRRTLLRDAERCIKLHLWLDNDREGENIAFEVVELCQTANPKIRIRRAKFCNLTERAIRHAARNLEDTNRFNSDAVDVRQVSW